MAGSKTVNRNRRTLVKTSGPQHTGDFKLIISCNGGRNAYVRNLALATNPNLATDSVEFADALRELAQAGHAAKLTSEIDALCHGPLAEQWKLTAKRLADESVLA